jgi:23S rRNA pseudouridine2605 synthase
VAERIQKVLARAGVASRRAAEQLVRDGRVSVNGAVVRLPGTLVDASKDVVAVDGQRVESSVRRHYYLLHKPPGYLSTAHDPHGRPTVLDLAPASSRLFPVGRLDFESEGLLLLTDDGELAHQLTHPRFEVPKEYHVLVPGPLPDAALVRLRTGVSLDEGRTAPAEVEVIGQEAGSTWICIVLRQGWKRQVRRMLATVGQPVRRLVRVRIGALTLGDLASGQVRRLSPSQIARALEAPGAPPDHCAGRSGRSG